jgi:hypothetical protein
MALQYDEILAGNCFGQINVAPPPCSNNSIMNEKIEQSDLSDEFGFPIEDLFRIARNFLKGKFFFLKKNFF